MAQNDDKNDKSGKIRIQKILSQSGLLSRRSAEDAITAGRIQLNGKKVTELGTKADPKLDKISLDGKKVEPRTQLEVILFHKPEGVITTKSDQEGRKTIMDFFPDQPYLNPVGRLDYESSGLLIMTNDGELTHNLTHPKFEVEKRYQLIIKGQFGPDKIKLLTEGIELDDGHGKFDKIEMLEESKDTDLIQREDQKQLIITISEGRNRFIRRMLNKVDLVVVKLVRIQMGPYILGDLKPGQKMTPVT